VIHLHDLLSAILVLCLCTYTEVCLAGDSSDMTLNPSEHREKDLLSLNAEAT